MTDDIVDFRMARVEKFFADRYAMNAAVRAGYKPIEDFAVWYHANGYSYDHMLHAFAYSAAAKCFRDLAKDDAADLVMETFVVIVYDLLCYGPHFGDEEYGGEITREQQEAAFAALQAAIEHFKTGLFELPSSRREVSNGPTAERD